MKTPSSPPSNTDENRSRTTDTINTSTRNTRRSHVSISSNNKRPSVNTGGHSSKFKQGAFRRAVPQMPRALAGFCFVLNLIFPGTGMNTTKLSQFTLDMRKILNYEFLTSFLSLDYQQICVFPAVPFICIVIILI
jgi:hypothetical protein